MQDFNDYLENRENELLNRKPQEVAFSLSNNEIQEIINKYRNMHNNRPAIENDWSMGNYSNHTILDVLNEIEKFNNLNDKNDYNEVRRIVSNLNNINDVSIPGEIEKILDEIEKHAEYLEYIEVANKKQTELIEKQETVEQEEEEKIEVINPEELKRQEERNKEVQSKLPIINEKLKTIRDYQNKGNKEKIVELLKERNYLYLNKDNITEEDLERLDNYIDELTSYEQELLGENKETKTDDTIEEYDFQIESLLGEIEPYRQVPTVDREISKVIEKYNEVKSLKAYNPSDYQKIEEMKKEIIEYLQKANRFIKDRQKPIENNNLEDMLQELDKQEVEEIIEDNNQKGSVGIFVLGLLLTIIGLAIVIISVVTTIKAV